jgi:hypothetical protein
LSYTLVGSAKPTQKQYGALPVLNLEKKFDLGQPSPPLKQPLT